MPDSLTHQIPRIEPLQGRSRASVKRIADAAGELLEEVGVNKLTMRLIAMKSGMSVGAVYKYFPNKIDVLTYLADQSLSQLRNDLDRLSPDTTSTGDFVVEWFNEMLEVTNKFYAKTPGMAQLAHSFPVIPELHRLEANHDDWVLVWMCDSLRAFGANCDQDDLEASVVVILASIHMTFLAMERFHDRFSRKAILSKLKLASSALLLSIVY